MQEFDPTVREKIDAALRQALEDAPRHRSDFPPSARYPLIRGIRWEHYIDSVGDDALRIRVILDEKTPDQDRTSKKLNRIKNLIRVNLQKQYLSWLFPYIFFVKESELAQQP